MPSPQLAAMDVALVEKAVEKLMRGPTSTTAPGRSAKRDSGVSSWGSNVSRSSLRREARKWCGGAGEARPGAGWCGRAAPRLPKRSPGHGLCLLAVQGAVHADVVALRAQQRGREVHVPVEGAGAGEHKAERWQARGHGAGHAPPRCRCW